MKKVVCAIIIALLSFSCFAEVNVSGHAGYGVRNVSTLNRHVHGAVADISFTFTGDVFGVKTGINIMPAMWGRDNSTPNVRLIKTQTSADFFAQGVCRIGTDSRLSLELGLGPAVGFSNMSLDNSQKGGFCVGAKATAIFSIALSQKTMLDINAGYYNWFYDKCWGSEFRDRIYMGSFDCRAGVTVKV